MKFSIIMPMYNVEEFVSESIESALSQSHENLELIIVNDGSKDESLKIAENFKKKDDRIKIINQENKGLVQARRVAIRESTGEYIVILDSDDLLESYSLQILKDTIIENGSDLILFKYKNIDIKGNVWKKQVHSLEGQNYSKELILKWFMIENKMQNIWGKCFKSELLKNDIIDYDIIGHVNMAEDRLQSLYGLFMAKNIYYLDEFLYNYRENPNSLTNKFNKKGIFDSIVVYNTIYNYYEHEFDKEFMDNVATNDLGQTIGKFYRWLSTNQVEKYEMVELIDYLVNSDIFNRAKNIKLSYRDKVLYKSISNRNILLIKIITILNRNRIKKQNSI